MKYVVIRCEDAAPAPLHAASLWEGAKLPHLQQLAQAGAAGLIRKAKKPAAFSGLELHHGLFGLGAQESGAAPARCYAASVNLQLAPGETAWCCELATQQNGRIDDPTAGGIPTKEGELLIQALNDRLGSETRRWEVGHGSHHLLVTRDDALRLARPSALRPPELLLGLRWSQRLPKGPLGQALRRLIEEASGILEDHPINRVRVDLHENPANMIWCWGPTDGRQERTFRERTGLCATVVSHGFPMRGFAHSLGLTWKEAPASLSEASLQRLLKTVVPLVESEDLVYVHLRIDAGDPVDRLCAMNRIDALLVKPITEALTDQQPSRLLVAVDDRPNGSVPFVAIGEGLSRHPVARLNAESFRESPLAFSEGAELFAWFTGGGLAR